MNRVDVLLEYFNLFKDILSKNDNNKRYLNHIDKVIKLLNTKTSFNLVDKDDYNKIIEYVSLIEPIEITNTLLTKYGVSIDTYKDSNMPEFIKYIILSANKGIDSVLYDLFFNIDCYNAYFMKQEQHIRTVDNSALIGEDLSVKDEIKVELKDILLYLEVNIDEIDSNLLKDLNKYANVEQLHNRAIVLKSGVGFMHFMYNRIKDKEVLLSILLHSNDNIISSLIEIFDKYNVNLNKVVDSIPSIFIKEPINSKCKYRIFGDYDNFINNVKLIEENDIDFKSMVNFPSFLVNDSESNRIVLEKFKTMGVNIKNVYEYIGNIVALSPNTVFNNIKVLYSYGIELTDDNNNNGYTILGMSNLSNKLDSLIENGLWKKSDGEKFDNLDLIRGLIIKNDYLMWKNNIKTIKVEDASLKDLFTDSIFDEDKLNTLFAKKIELASAVEKMDNEYLNLEEGFYVIDNKIISRIRFLRNLCNYQGKGTINNIVISSLKYASNLNDEVINEIISNLEMGDKSVKLS